MRVRVVSVFRDKDTHEIYEVGAEREFNEARAKHLVSLGLAELIAEPQPAPAPKPEPEPAEEKVEVKEQEPAEVKAEVETKDEEPSEKKTEPEPQEKVVSERHRGRKITKE